MIRSTTVCLSFVSVVSWAGEMDPLIESKPMPNSIRIKKQEAVMRELFRSAEGLRTQDVHTMHFNRISCDRRIFTSNGASLEGDGNLLVSNSIANYFEVEFRSNIYMGEFNPFGNRLAMMESIPMRQLFDFNSWNEGESLTLKKMVTVRYDSENDEGPKTVFATDEFKGLPDTYPRAYIVRETVHTKPKFTFYLVCQ